MSAIAERERAIQLVLAPERRRGEPEAPRRRRRERPVCSDGGRLTLEQLFERSWEGLHAAGVTDCPLCGGRMTAPPPSGPAAGHCADCGSVLA